MKSFKEHEIVCLTYKKVYPSISYASKITRTDIKAIQKCVSCFKEYTVNDERTKLEWMCAEMFKECYGEDAYWKLHRTTQDFYTNDNWGD